MTATLPNPKPPRLVYVTMAAFLLFATLGFFTQGCAGNAFNITADDIKLSGKIKCTGSGDVTFKDSVTVGIEGTAGVGAELAGDGDWGACERLAFTFGEAKWIFLDEEQGALECQERAGQVVFVPPPGPSTESRAAPD